MVRTAKDRALYASGKAAAAARRRRFTKYAEEMAAHPQDINLEAGLILANIVTSELGLAYPAA